MANIYHIQSAIEHYFGVKRETGFKYGITPAVQIVIFPTLKTVLHTKNVTDFGVLTTQPDLLYIKTTYIKGNRIQYSNQVIDQINEHIGYRPCQGEFDVRYINIIPRGCYDIENHALDRLNFKFEDGDTFLISFDTIDAKRFSSALSGFVPVNLDNIDGIPTFTLRDAYFYRGFDTSDVLQLCEQVIREEYPLLQNFTIKTTEEFDTAVAMCHNNNVRGGKIKHQTSKIRNLISFVKEKLLC